MVSAMIKNAFSIAIAFLALTLPTLAAGEGTAVGVKPDAVARQGTQDRVLIVGSDVSVGQKIITGPSGNVQLLFDDDTRIVVGPGSSLEIESYLLNGSRSDRFAVNALAGTFRFISGNSPKSVYSIDTPTASIAVRGTSFDLAVQGRITLTMLYAGALRVCYGPSCVELTKRCDIASNLSGDAVAHGWTTGGRPSFINMFGLANIQAAFANDFRIAGAQACLAPQSSNTPSSLSDSIAVESNNQTCTYPYTNC